MKKKYISPEIIEVTDFGNPMLDIGTTIPVDTGGSGESQSGAEGKRHNDVVDEDEEPTDSIIKYRRDPMDFIPKSFTKVWED